jgi:hypothetical protein
MSAKGYGSRDSVQAPLTLITAFGPAGVQMMLMGSFWRKSAYAKTSPRPSRPCRYADHISPSSGLTSPAVPFRCFSGRLALRALSHGC